MKRPRLADDGRKTGAIVGVNDWPRERGTPPALTITSPRHPIPILPQPPSPRFNNSPPERGYLLWQVSEVPALSTVHEPAPHFEYSSNNDSST